MSEQKDFKFHVIELFEPKYTDPERYVCVPNSWVRLCKTYGVASVKFPIEELSDIKKRAKKEEFSDDWKDFLADIKFSTNSYKDASNIVKILNKISDQKQNRTKIVDDTRIPSTSDQKVLESLSSSETNEVHTASTLSSDGKKPVEKETTEQINFTDTKVEICQEKIQVGIFDSSPKPRKYFTRQSLRMSSSANNPVILLDQTARNNRPNTSKCVAESDKSDNNHNQKNESSAKNHLDLPRKWQVLMALRSVLGDGFKEVLKQLHNEYEKMHLVLECARLAFFKNCKIIEELIKLTDEVINSPDISGVGATVEKLENSTMVMDVNENNSDEGTRITVQNIAQKKKKQNSDGAEVLVAALRSVLGDNFKEVLKHLHKQFERNHLILETMRLAFIKNRQCIEELIKLTDEVINGPDVSDLGAKIKELENSMTEVDINKNNSNEVTESEVQNDAQKQNKKKHNSDGTKVKNTSNNPLNKIRGQARKFTFPPEYDANDSRWTLKHRKKKKGLVELVPDSRVYVDAIKLGNCKIISKDSKTLARTLLLEIFSKNALSICSLTGKKANAFDYEGTSVKPRLDEHAIIVLLNYVEKHALQQKWAKFEALEILKVLRNKIQEMRGKYG